MDQIFWSQNENCLLKTVGFMASADSEALYESRIFLLWI